MPEKRNMLKSIWKMRAHHQIIISLIIAAAVIAYWRGIWDLLDIYLMPQNEALSYWISIALGILILFGTHTIAKELM